MTTYTYHVRKLIEFEPEVEIYDIVLGFYERVQFMVYYT